MSGRAFLGHPERGFSLPAYERLAPPPPPSVIAARIDAATSPGDIVLDLHGRGGWVARAALDRQRRAITIESSPLTRLLAEVVLRPPDLRHLDAAFQSLSAAPRGNSSLKLSIGEPFGSRCATCERPVVLDELVWERPSEGDDEPARPVRKHYRCIVCRDQIGGGEQRHALADDADVRRAASLTTDGVVRARIRDRFPVLEGGDRLVEDLLDLHSPRQLVGLAAILERIDGDLRSPAIEASLRLALLHAIMPASRLNGFPGRLATLRVSGGRVRLPPGAQWRERNPWLAFEDGVRIVRGFVQRLEGGATGPVQARFGEDLRSLVEGSAAVSVRLGGPPAIRALERDARDAARGGPGVRLVLCQPPLRPSQDRLAFSYYATGWLLGREAASLLPIEPLIGAPIRVPWAWQASALRRSLDAAAPLLARDGRAIILVEQAGPEALVAATLGGVGAGFRVTAARLAEVGEEVGGAVELAPPGAAVPSAPRTRANQPLDLSPGGFGDPDMVPAPGLFAPPERYDQRPFSEIEAASTVSEAAIETLKARGEPAREEQLLGEILVSLDRSGHLRRLVAGSLGSAAPDADAGRADSTAAAGPGADPRSTLGAGRASSIRSGVAARVRASVDVMPGADPIERLLALIRDELGRAGQRRLLEIEPGRWWLADRADRDAAAVPLADRVEWAVYSLLSTAGPMAEATFFERMAGLFRGHDLPDEVLVRACLESYRSLASTSDRLLTSEDVLRRTHEHGELLALLTDLGHRLGLRVWLGRREQGRMVDGRALGDRLDARERNLHLPTIARAPADALDDVDCIWYVRGKATLLFELDWTAMLGEPVLRLHSRIPPDENIVRFLVIAPERTELVRHKLERSPLLRAALEEGNWHVLKSNHLRGFDGLEAPSLGDLEPLLGLDPRVERSAEQLPLF